MLISAKEISEWAASREAQGDLPKLVRRLIGECAKLRSLSMPAGGAVSEGGFDGELVSDEGNTWVPKGGSVWELSVESRPRTKAERDYNKRTSTVHEDVRKGLTYVAVTGRKWKGRKAWAQGKAALGEWADVKAYDADDLELWLEQELSVQIWFAESLGMPTDALQSVDAYWANWNRDVSPQISLEALVASRDREVARLFELITTRKDGGTIVIHADSSEEAIAFTCAALLLAKGEEKSRSVVVTGGAGWSAVAANTHVHIAIASETPLASKVRARKGLIAIVPIATGDSEAHFPGHRGLDFDPDICLQRLLPEDFRTALVEMGVDRGDAERLTIQCGRSWSVFRRQKNQNPAGRQPTWHDVKFEVVLTTMALAGAYVEKNATDRSLIESISGVSYSTFAAEVERLIRQDDAPIIRINGVIKAKAPLELFKVNEAGISEEMFERFLTNVKTELGAKAPEFDLPREERWLAGIKGAVRPISGAFFRALADALPRIATLTSRDGWNWRVTQSVKHLVAGAARDRWLAISSILPQLAEAAPEEFLSALEADLQSPGPNVFALFEESGQSGMNGACVFASLLWALEALAWAPNRLLRVSRILADLEKAPSEHGYGNSPSRSLLNIYRGWRPQTSANIDQRNRGIAALAKTHPDQAFNLCMGILHRGDDFAFPSAHPHWRDDDAGNTEAVLREDYAGALRCATDIAFQLAGSSPDRALALFERYRNFSPDDRGAVISALALALAEGTASDVRTIRKAIRQKLHWEYNYGGDKIKALPAQDINVIEKLYRDSEPADLIERHQWLFAKGYCELPEKEGRWTSDGSFPNVEARRRDALQEIFDQRGLDGVSALAEAAGNGIVVGSVLLSVDMDLAAFHRAVAHAFARDDVPEYMTAWLPSLREAEAGEYLQNILAVGLSEYAWSDEVIVRLLLAARCDPVIWEVVGRQVTAIQEAYWIGVHCVPPWLDKEPLKRGVKLLVQYGNAAGALRSMLHNERDFDANGIAEILELNFSSRSEALKELHLHNITELVNALERDPDFDRQRLLRLEFQLSVVFGQFVAEVMSELQRELVTDPDQLLFVTQKVYKPDKLENLDKTLEEQDLLTAFGNILFYTNLTPGAERDGSFSEPKAREFVERYLGSAREAGYTRAAQLVLGKLLAFAPRDNNGNWPPSFVCEVLDQLGHEEMRGTFEIEVLNRRGITSRSPYDGGDQERALAREYQGYAEACEIEYPLASRAIMRISEHYQRDALYHDRDAESSKERF